MERVNIIKDICQQLELVQIDNSWIKTLGAYLNVAELPGSDDYEQRVFTAAISNTNIVIPAFTLITEDHGNQFNLNTIGYNFTGNGVSLTNSLDNIVEINIPGGGGVIPSGLFGISDLGVYTYYSTLQDAVDAASGAQVIEVFGDYTEVMPVTITLKDGININGNGYSYTAINGTVNAFYGDAVNIKIQNYKITVTELKEWASTQASAFLLVNSVVDFTGSEVYAVAETGQLEMLAFRMDNSEIRNLVLSANGNSSYGIQTLESAPDYSIIRNCIVSSSADALTGNANIYNCYFNGSVQCNEVHNSTVIGNVSVAIIAFKIYNSNSINVNGSAMICYDRAYNSVAYSVNGIGGINDVNDGTYCTYENCSFISENNKSFSTNANTIFKNCNFTSLFNNASGHALEVYNSGSTFIDIMNCTFEVANAGANCINSSNAITVNYSNNSFKVATTPVHANITQGIVNTSDSQGNIVPGGGSDLAGTLNLGNTTGANNILISDDQVIRADNGGGELNLRFGGLNNEVLLSNDNSVGGAAYIYIDENNFITLNSETAGEINLVTSNGPSGESRIKLNGTNGISFVQKLNNIILPDASGTIALVSDIPTLPYRSYVARLTQSGTNPPVATVIYNDLGQTLTWLYGAPGIYWAKPTDDATLFADANKVTLMQGSNIDIDPEEIILSQIQPGFGVGGDENYIRIQSYYYPDPNSNDGFLNGKFIEIRVYN